MRAPEEAGLGKAKVTFSFEKWKDGHVAASTIEILITEPKSTKKDASKQ